MNKLLFSFLFLFLFVFQSFSQNQYNRIGILYGTGSNSGFRNSMSDDGTIVALNNNDGSKVYRYSNNTWTQLGQDISDYSLNSISLSGDGTTVATGRVTAGTEFQGEVRVYKYTNNTWTELGNGIRGEAWTDESGNSVSLSRDGTRVAIGAPRAGGPYINDGNEENAGHVRVYDWDGYNWKKIGQDIDGEAAGDWSGYSVSLSDDGNRVAIGAIFNDGGGINAGHVRVYQYANNSWTQIGSDIDGYSSNGNINGGAGYSVSLSGDGNRLIMGSPFSPISYGRVYHYENNTWLGVTPIWGNNTGNLNVPLGWSVSMSRDGNTVAVGDRNYDININADNSGRVFVMRYINNFWTKVDSLYGSAAGEYYGSSVSLSANGDRLAVGSPGNHPNGKVSVYETGYAANNTCPVAVNDTIKLYGPFGPQHIGMMYVVPNGNELGVLDNDTDIDNNPLTATLVSNPSYVGKVTMHDDGSYIFGIDGSPLDVLNSNSSDSFTYMANDGYCNSNVATVHIQLLQCPYASPDTYQVDQGSTLNVSSAQGVLANDTVSIVGRNLTASIDSNPSHGTLTMNQDGSFTYTHDGSNSTTDSFTYKANDGTCDSKTTVTINIKLTGEWMKLGEVINGESNYDSFGSSVSLSSDGSVVAMGAPDASGTAAVGGAGQVRIFKYLNNNWTQLGQDIYGGVNHQISGRFISLSSDGTKVAISANGSVRIYQYTNSTWTKIGQDLTFYDQQIAGAQISLNSDGSYIAIGEYQHENNKGRVRIYRYENNSWNQFGSDIIGEAAGDKSGYSISISSDGTKIAIGSPYSNANGQWSGRVSVYRYTHLGGGIYNWKQIGDDIDGEGISSRCGSSVSLSDNGYTVALATSGKTRIYRWSSGWTQLGQDILSQVFHESALSLSSDGSKVAIGSSGSNGNGTGSGAGHVSVYQLLNNTWEKIGQDIDGEAAGDKSGRSISISDNGYIVAIGSPGSNGNGTGSGAGHVSVYQLSNNECPLVTSESYNVNQGSSITIPANQGLLVNDMDPDADNLTATIKPNVFGNYLYHGFISCQDPNDPKNGDYNSICSNGSFTYVNDGSFRVSDTIFYEVSDRGCELDGFAVLNITGFPDPNNWTQLGQDLIGEEQGDDFGSSISMNKAGDIMAVGGLKNNNSGGDNAGHVRVFKYENNSWNQIGQDIDGKYESGYFGYSISLSDDGYTIAIGQDNTYIPNTQQYFGEESVRIFKYENNIWNQTAEIVPPEYWSEDNSGFGDEIELSGDGNRLAIGASLIDLYGTNSGSVLLYENNGSLWSKIGSIDGESSYEYLGDEQAFSMNKDGSRIAFISRKSKTINIFGYFGNGNWSQIGQEIYTDDHRFDYVSMSGDGNTISVSVHNTSSYYVFDFIRVFKLENNSWTQIGQDVHKSNPTYSDGGKSELNYDGTRLAVGEDYNEFEYFITGNIMDCCGSARIYELKNDSWMQIGQTIYGQSNDFEENYFGSALSINADGTRVAFGDWVGGNESQGLVQVYSYPIIAGNTCPLGVDDEYTVARGISLTINAGGGVLANDTDDDGDPLTASLVTQPSHGTLTFSSDGSFTYANDGSNANSDSFTYRANDGTCDSQTIMVNFTISDVATGIENITPDILKIYPNPVDNRLKIELEDNVKVERVEFIDYSGKIYTPSKIERKGNKLTVFISNIESGNYILTLLTDRGLNQSKVVVER